MSDENIILYGAGKIGREALSVLRYLKKNIMYFIDADSKKNGTEIDGVKIYDLNYIDKSFDGYVYITTVKGVNSIIIKLIDSGIDKNKIIIYDNERIKLLSKYLSRNLILIKSNKQPSISFGELDGLELGGIEEWTKQIVNCLCDKNYNVNIIYSGNIQYANKKYIYVKLSEDIDEKLNNIKGIVNCILENNTKILITSHPDELLKAACVLKYLKHDIKIICVIHEGIESNYKDYQKYDKYIDIYMGVSIDICEGLENSGINKSKIFHMTCPVNFIDKYEKKRNYTLNKENPIQIGYAGRIEIEQKRMDLLIKLILELERLNINYNFNIAGDGSYKNQMQLMINKNGLNEKVRFLGRIDRKDIYKFWQSNDICVNIADYEGRSISIMEAMVNGAVPIVTRTSGIKEDIHNGVEGFYVNIGDYESMAKKIQQLEDNRDYIKELGSNAKEEMQLKCDINNHITFWIDILDKYIK